MTRYAATMTKVQDAQPLGEYRPTAVDARKEAAEIRIVSVDDGKFTLFTEISLKGRGVKPINGGYEVTRKALEKIEGLYEVVTDF